LPLDDEAENRIEFQTTGPAVCTVVTEIDVLQVTDGVMTRELLSHDCDQNSSLTIRLLAED
jgi:hypothetical protein